MMRYSSFPGCLLYFPGCLIFSFLLSRTDFVVVSKNVPDNRLRLTQDPKGIPQLTQNKNFDELGTIRLQENIVENESHEQTPADKISKTLKARLDSDAKSFERENVSPETQMKRIRRNPNYAVFDEEEICNLTDIAIQQCPYNAFCHRNRTTVPKFRAGYGSCCKDCYCDEQCGERMDCCWDFIDTTKIEEQNALTCITPVILPANEQLEDDPSYLMVDSCHGNDSYECRRENAAVWGPLFPASSPSTSLIYFNEYCAKCNGVTDSTPWDTYVSCNGTNSLSGLSLIGGLKRKQCRVRFRPPKKANTEKFTCNAEIISTCSLTERSFKTNVDLEKACRLTKANVIAKNRDEVGYLTYANIFCKLCEGHVHYPDGACRAIDLYRSPAVTKFTTFIDWRLLDSVASDAIDTIDTSKRRQKQKMCGENEVKHPTKVRTSSRPQLRLEAHGHVFTFRDVHKSLASNII